MSRLRELLTEVRDYAKGLNKELSNCDTILSDLSHIRENTGEPLSSELTRLELDTLQDRRTIKEDMWILYEFECRFREDEDDLFVSRINKAIGMMHYRERERKGNTYSVKSQEVIDLLGEEK